MKHQPIKLNPIFKERVWGGTNLSDFNYSLPSDKIGEAWLFCDHLEGKNTPLLDSSYMGQKAFSNKTNRANILIKLLDSQDDLSIQVHPSDEYKNLGATELGKAEVWYVLSAEEDAKIIYGLSESSSFDSLTNAIKNDTILLEVNKISIKKGDIVYIPPGTVHALCKGVVVIEIQQNSDTTFRLFDYNRLGLDGKPRDLHIEESLKVIDFYESYPKIKQSSVELDNGWSLIERNKFFVVEEALISTILNISCKKDCFTFLFCIDGSGSIIWEEKVFEINKGDCFMLPSSNKNFFLDAKSTLHILRSYIE